MADKNRLRNKMIRAWLYEYEYDAIMEHCNEHNISLSAFFRNTLEESVRNTPKPVFSNDDAYMLFKELNAIGKNVNQIAYKYNAKHSGDNEMMIELQESFTALLTLYQNWIDGKED